MRGTAAQKLVIELINAHKEKREGEQRIGLTRKLGNKLRKGVPENRTPYGIAATEKGKVLWQVLTVPGGYDLFYLSKEPNTHEKALQKQQEKALDHLTTTIGTMKLEAWSITQEHKDATLEYWKSLRRKTPAKRRKGYPYGTEGPTATSTTYQLTAYRYIQHYTPTEKKRITMEDLETLVYHDGKYCTYELEEEAVLSLETDDPTYLQTIQEKAEEWRLAYGITALTTRILNDRQPEHVQHLQYKRVGEAKPRVANHPEWGMKQSRARAWQIVDHIDTSREVLQYAYTGKDY